MDFSKMKQSAVDELSAGARFDVRVDDADPRFDLVRLRVPVRPLGTEATREPVSYEGYSANLAALEYYLQQAAGVCDQLHAHETASRVREVLAVHRTTHAARARDAQRRARCDA